MTYIATPIDKDLELPTRTKYFQTETKSITVFDAGDPTVGIPATQFTLGSNFYFDEPEHLEDFKRDLMKLLGDHDQTQGRTSALTDWELEAMQDYSPCRCKNIGEAENCTINCGHGEEPEPECTDCGSDNLAYIEQYANGCEYQCKDCDKKKLCTKMPNKIATLIGVFAAMAVEPPFGYRSGDGQGSRYKVFHFDAFGRLCPESISVFSRRSTNEESARRYYNSWRKKNEDLLIQKIEQ